MATDAAVFDIIIFRILIVYWIGRKTQYTFNVNGSKKN